MRWNDVFDDLEAQLAAAERAELAAEVADRTRRERATVAVADRLVTTIGRRVGLRLLGGELFEGDLAEVGKDWLLLEPQNGGGVLVPLAQIAVLDGLAVASDPRPGVSRRRYGIGVVLREIGRDRSVVRVVLPGDGVVEGRIAVVGADHVDLAREEGDLVARRRRGPAATVSLAAARAFVVR